MAMEMTDSGVELYFDIDDGAGVGLCYPPTELHTVGKGVEGKTSRTCKIVVTDENESNEKLCRIVVTDEGENGETHQYFEVYCNNFVVVVE